MFKKTQGFPHFLGFPQFPAPLNQSMVNGYLMFQHINSFDNLDFETPRYLEALKAREDEEQRQKDEESQRRKDEEDNDKQRMLQTLINKVKHDIDDKKKTAILTGLNINWKYLDYYNEYFENNFKHNKIEFRNKKYQLRINV
jgi:hypothetical protein